MRYIENLPTEINKTLLFSEISPDELEGYINQVFKLKNKDSFKIVISDHQYDNISKSNSSEVIMYEKETMLQRFLLKEASVELTELGICETRYDIPNYDLSELSYSNVVSCQNNSNYISVIDHLFKKIVFYDKKSENFTVFNIDSLNMNILYELGIGCKNCFDDYMKFRNVLKQVNFDKPRVSMSYGNTSPITALVTVPTITLEGKDLDIYSKSVPIQFRSPEEFEIIQIDYSSVPDGFFYSDGVFYTKDEHSFLYLKPTNKGNLTEERLLGRFLLKNGKYEFLNFVDITIPDEYINSGLRYQLLYPRIVDDLVFFEFSLNLYDLELHKLLKLPLNKVKINSDYQNGGSEFESSFRLIDLLRNDNIVKVLIKEESNYYLIRFNLKNEIIESKSEVLNIPNYSELKSKVYLNSDNEIFYVTNANELKFRRLQLK